MQDEVPLIFEAVFQCTLEVTDSMVHWKYFPHAHFYVSPHFGNIIKMYSDLLS